MSDSARRAGGITMLDGAALVTGGAVASVHFRDLTDAMFGLTILGWLFLAAAFGWLALTSAGPFVFLVRRYSTRPIGYPSAEDRLWLLIGLPWLLTALYRSAVGNPTEPPGPTYETCLFIGLVAASALAIGQVSRTWTATDSGRRRPGSWTDLIGRVVSVTWPLQFGLAFVVTR